MENISFLIIFLYSLKNIIAALFSVFHLLYEVPYWSFSDPELLSPTYCYILPLLQLDRINSLANFYPYATSGSLLHNSVWFFLWYNLEDYFLIFFYNLAEIFNLFVTFKLALMYADTLESDWKYIGSAMK